MAKKKSLETLVLGLCDISEALVKGTVETIFPAPPIKHKWCQCSRCKQWHRKAE